MPMITAASWVPRGYTAPFPTKYVFDDDEYGRIAKLAKLQLEDAEENLAEARGNTTEDVQSGSKSNGKAAAANLNSKEDQDDDLKEYDLEHYDGDEGGEEQGEKGGLDIFGNARQLAYHESNADDPYITIPDNEDDDDEREDLQILPTDNLLLTAKVEDEVAHLEVYVYEDEADNLYVHHDIMLPDIPLCIEWLDIPVNKPAVGKDSSASFVAVGTMSPDIEIWDLDVTDCMYPNAILGQGAEGGAVEKPAKKKKKKKSRKPNDEYHVDAVLALAANRKVRNLLASSSADATIKLWDLHTTKCAKSYSYHTDKVCAIAWHPQEATALLSGSYDRTVVAADMRAPGAKAPRWSVESDVETVRWDPHNEHHFFATTENGFVHYHDARAAPVDPSNTKSLWSLQAHDESVSAFDVNPIIPGYLVTGSIDKEVKLWNIQPGSGPSMVVSRNLGVGKIFTASFAPDQEVGFRLAVAGSKGAVQIWDTSTNPAVRRIFADRVAPSKGEVKERMVGLQEEDESESDDGDEDAEDDGEQEEGWEDEDEDAMEE